MTLNYLFQLFIELNYTKKQGSNHCTESVVWMDHPTKPITFIASYSLMMRTRFGWKKFYETVRDKEMVLRQFLSKVSNHSLMLYLGNTK